VIGSQLKSEVIGAAYNSDFLLAKTEYIPTETHTEEDNYAAALEWMEALGVDIISSSLGYSEFDADQISYLTSEMDGKTTIVTQAAELAFRFGVLTISSAGNEGDDAWKIITAPADGFNTLAIGAVNSNGEVTGFSGRGPTADGRIKPDIMAMGSSVVGLNPASGIIQGNGTSLSAPIAAGVAALLYEAFPHLNNQQARAILLESGDRVNNPDNDYGYGNVSAMKAIAYPNLEKIGNEFKLNKRFENHDQIESESVEIIYSINGVVENNKKMTIMSDNSYSFTFPQFQGGDSISFRINYLNDAQEIQTEPKTGYYRFIYGKKIIYNLLSTTEEEYPQDDTITVNSVSNVFPNPFMPSIYTNAKFEVNLKNESSISGEIFNLLGQSVWRFAKSGLESGTHLILWNGLNNSGTKIGSGVYLYRFQIGNESFEGKLVVIR
ncbi:MAG: S8 family serine peptidase, partial [Melioribacteraceae bacterium]|nr:S8 family serine peptidase [Melioribacteraceae bacterium]